MDIVITDLKAEDVPDVIVIERLSFSTPWSEVLFLNEANNPRSIAKAARTDGKIVGYIIGSHVVDEGSILNVSVHPDYRLQGIGSRLLEHMIGLLGMKGCMSLFIEVRATNEKAIRMYERTGFMITGKRKGYYVSPVEDAAIMALQLPAQP
jgi:ribosomal-protein-alanine N-acetyltransferase